MSNVRVTAGPAEPCEGLPPCQTQMAMFEDRVANLFDYSLCNTHGDLDARRYGVSVGVIQTQEGDTWHPGCAGGTLAPGAPIYLLTDDAAEAQGAFERGSEYVRTGNLP